MSSDAFLRPDSPVEIEGKNFRRSFRELQIGPSYRVTFEVPKDLWDACEAIPRDAIVRGVLYHTSGDEKAPTMPKSEPVSQDDEFEFGVKQEPEAYAEDDGPALPLPKPEKVQKEKGRWGSYWNRMYAKGFDTFPELLKELHVNGMGDSVKKALRARFHCPSLTMVSPDMFVTWATGKRLPRGLIEKSERAVEELGGVKYKWGKKDNAA